MADLIYCKHFTHSPYNCGGIAYQITYDSNGNADGAYRCNFCYKEKAISAHQILLATQAYTERLEAENAELRKRNEELEKANIKLKADLINARDNIKHLRRMCSDGYISREF